MLKAYDYAERTSNNFEIQNTKLFQQEKAIALKYVLEHPVIHIEKKCSICGSKNTKYIFQRWDINYQFCNECNSIFVAVEDRTIKEYLELEEMKILRGSEEYQMQAEERRGNIWNDIVMWAEYRTFRYLGRREGLNIVDFGNRYRGFVYRFKKSLMTCNYELRDSILEIETDKVDSADVILYLNQLQHEYEPATSLKEIGKSLKDEGVLILNTRLGSGFDILTLKGETDDIFPYEHVMLPSKKGLKIILEKAGFELLEITTPGTRDMDVVLKNKFRIEESNFFLKYLLDTADAGILTDFQQFLQKSGLSSFAQVVARKRK